MRKNSISKLILFFLLTFHIPFMVAQRDITQQILGEWFYEGTTISGTFYPTNTWNKEQFFFKRDYRFKHIITGYIDKQIITQTVDGSWELSNDSTYILLFYDQNRVVKDIPIKTIYKSIRLYFLNDNYLVNNKTSGDLKILDRYIRSSVVNVNFEDDYNNYLLELDRKNSVLDTIYYNTIEQNSSIMRKYKSAYYTFVTDELKENPFKRTIKTIDGKILSIQNNSITIQPRFQHTKTYEKSNKSSINIKLYDKRDLEVEVPTNFLKKLYLPSSTIGMEVSTYFTIASIATTLIATPIVALTSNSQVRNRNSLITAGTGLLGIGIGTGSFFIFRSFEKKFGKDKKDSVFLSPIFRKKK